MVGCQVGQSPSMLAAYNCVPIIIDNTNKEKKKDNEKKTLHATPLYLYNHTDTLIVTD